MATISEMTLVLEAPCVEVDAIITHLLQRQTACAIANVVAYSTVNSKGVKMVEVRIAPSGDALETTVVVRSLLKDLLNEGLIE